MTSLLNILFKVWYNHSFCGYSSKQEISFIKSFDYYYESVQHLLARNVYYSLFHISLWLITVQPYKKSCLSRVQTLVWNMWECVDMLTPSVDSQRTYSAMTQGLHVWCMATLLCLLQHLASQVTFLTVILKLSWFLKIQRSWKAALSTA